METINDLIGPKISGMVTDAINAAIRVGQARNWREGANEKRHAMLSAEQELKEGLLKAIGLAEQRERLFWSAATEPIEAQRDQAVAERDDARRRLVDISDRIQEMHHSAFPITREELDECVSDVWAMTDGK